MSLFVKKGTVVTPPNTFTVPRDDRAYEVEHQPRVHVRMPAMVDAQTAPTPTPYSSFAGVGRITSARWFDQVLAIQDKLSIRAWEGAGSALVQRIPGAMVVNMPRSAGQNPMSERADIDPPAQTTYASLATLHPEITYNAAYRKLM